MLDPDGDPSTNDAPRVVSNSWGSSSQFVYSFKNVIRAWRAKQIFPNFAAGNSGPTAFSVSAPGSYPFSFAVGAIDEDSNVTSFSSRGPTIWFHNFLPHFVTKPDVSAPGFKVKSALPGGTWGEYSGTSMATPHVAGVIAMAYASNPSLKVEDVMEILKASALDRGKQGIDNRFGYGIIQADQVVEKSKSWSKNPNHPNLMFSSFPAKAHSR